MGKVIPASVRPASGFQLWRLNVCGLIRLVDEHDEDAVVSAADAKTAVARELARLGISRFPRAGEQYPDPPEEPL